MDLTAYLPWLKYVHVVGVMVFVLVHGASALVSLRVRRERDRDRLRSLLDLSLAYQTWGWGSMTPIPTGYLNDVRHALGMPTYNDSRQSRQPPPPATDEELARILESPRPIIGAAIGSIGIAVLAYLMMFKPF